MRRIRLTRGQWLIIDDSDWERVKQHTWCSSDGRGGRWYAVSRINGRLIRLHRLILNPKPKESVDHINGNTLDNRRKNLRLCEHRQNARNLRIERGVKKTSRYKGVCWNPRNGNWTAQIMVNYRKIHIGCFNREADAARAYDIKATLLFKEFAKRNFA